MGAFGTPLFLPDYSGGGDISGPASSTDNAIVRWDGTTGKTIQNSGVTVSDADIITTSNAIVWDAGVAGTNENYQIYRNNATTNELTLNVPSTTNIMFSFSGANRVQIGNNTTLFNNALQINDDQLFHIGSESPLDMGIWFNTLQTVDTSQIMVSGTSNHHIICQIADRNFDFTHAQTTNPTIFIHSANQSTTEWISLTHDQTNGVINTGAGTLRFDSANMWTANGTATVSITNVAPTGVGTATISQWFTVVASDGVTYYIPAWT